jgi:hypothetical protein
MQNHPLTPMTDSNLVRVLQAQCRRNVGLIDYRIVGAGAGAIRARIAECAVSAWASPLSTRSRTMICARSAPRCPTCLSSRRVRRRHRTPGQFGIAPSNAASALPPVAGARAIVSGSCSTATNLQVRTFIDDAGQAYRVDPTRIAAGADVAAEALAWAASRLDTGTVLVYSTAERAAVTDVQRALGAREAGDIVEAVLATIARGLVERGVRRLVVAGGENGRGLRCVVGYLAIENRAADRSRSAVVLRACRRERRRPPSGVEVGQFRLAGLLHQGIRAVVMTESQARDEICRVGRSLFERSYVHGTAGNISVRLDESQGGRLPDHTHGRVPRISRRLAPRAARRRRTATARRAGEQGDGAARADLCGIAAVRSRHGMHHPHARHALRRIDAVATADCDRPAAADHALLRDEGGPRSADGLSSTGLARRRS